MRLPPPALGSSPSEDASTRWSLHARRRRSTPANYFHALRRQQHRDFRKPLIVASTKALLRHKLAVSSLDEFATGSRFRRTYGEAYPDEVVADADVRRLVLCSGKIYYELLEARRRLGGPSDVALAPARRSTSRAPSLSARR